MNQTYWAEKQKNQTQMLRVIHDQIDDQSQRTINQTKRIDLLVERIDILSYAVSKWSPITVKQKKEFEKAIKPKKKKTKGG